jgi:hypothetical protein
LGWQLVFGCQEYISIFYSSVVVWLQHIFISKRNFKMFYLVIAFNIGIIVGFCLAIVHFYQYVGEEFKDE